MSISLGTLLLRMLFLSVYFFASLFNFQYFLLDVLFILFAHAHRSYSHLFLSLYFDNFWMSPTKCIEVRIGYVSTGVRGTES
jgi:hypothetical protein